MGNKLSASPFPSYEAAAGLYSTAEMLDLKRKFVSISGGQDTINLAAFVAKSAPSSAYTQRQICPRMFLALDIKKDGVIDFEEYLCAVTVFRSGTLDDKAKCVFLMYEGSKSGGNMSKDNFRQLVVDSGLCAQKSDASLQVLEQWLTDMKALSQAVAEAGFVQYASHASKMEIQEFVHFAKKDSAVQAFFPLFVSILDS